MENLSNSTDRDTDETESFKLYKFILNANSMLTNKTFDIRSKQNQINNSIKLRYKMSSNEFCRKKSHFKTLIIRK